MDHIVLLEPKSQVLDHLLSKKKTYLLRGSMGKKAPYGKIKVGDPLYFASSATPPMVQAKGTTTKLLQPDKLGKEQSLALISGFEDKLLLSKEQEKKYLGKRYIILIEVGEIEPVEPFAINPEKTEETDDWLMIRNIARAKL